MMVWTEAKLRELSPEKLRKLYENALIREGNEAAQIVGMIEVVGVPPQKYSGVIESPTVRRMREVINSNEVMQLGIAAAERGLSPLGSIDPILQAKLGADYRGDDRGTLEAGFLVAEMMRKHHWEPDPKGRRQKLPTGCVAKTAALFVHIPPKKKTSV